MSTPARPPDADARVPADGTPDAAGAPVIRRASLARSLPPVYAAAAVRVAFPLLVLPVMAGRLGVEEFGRLGLCLVWAGLLSLVVEGGFLAAATRHAVTADAGARLRLARQVFSARCVLTVPVVLAALAIGGWVIPGAAGEADRWEVAALIALLACALGWPATWYLQATMQLHRWAWVDLAVQVLLLAACLGLAHSLKAYLLLQGLASAALAGLGWAWLRRDLGPGEPPALLDADGLVDAAPNRLWTPSEVRSGLVLGGAMLPVSVIGSAYSLALPAVAATQLGRAELGVYYLADRMVRALVAGADPLMQLVYPRIVERFARGARVALAYAARWSAAGWVAGTAIGLAVWIGWPLWQGLVGGGIDPARLRAVLAVTAWLIPLVMGWRFLAYWMLGSGRYDRAYRGCIVVGGLVGIGGAWAYGTTAVALAGVALAAELAVMAAAGLGMAATEWRRRHP